MSSCVGLRSICSSKSICSCAYVPGGQGHPPTPRIIPGKRDIDGVRFLTVVTPYDVNTPQVPFVAMKSIYGVHILENSQGPLGHFNPYAQLILVAEIDQFP